jgi:Phage Tail Collar Domain
VIVWKRRRLPYPNHATVVSYLALFVALGGSAYAVTGSSSSMIRACYARNTGALRLLRSGRCARGERLLSWNRNGRPGARGPQGPSGTVDTSQSYTKSESDERYLPIAATAANSSELGGQAPSAFAQSADVYTTSQSDARYLPIGGTAANASELGGQVPSAFAQSSLFGSPASVSSGSSGSDPYCILGEIKLTATAGASLPTNWMLAHGQTLTIASNTALFSLLGTTYGGNGSTTFDLPNLQGAEPKGAGPAGINYAICTSGIFP